jgi:hypothetical protein
MIQKTIKLDGYTELGVMGHWEPFRHTRKYKVDIELPEYNRGSIDIDDIPFKGAWTTVQIDDIMSDFEEIEGEAYCRPEG